MIAALALSVGLQVGDFASPFEPFHVTGPYAGGVQCPVCEWATLPMVFIWTNQPDKTALQPIVKKVQSLVAEIGPKKIKGLVIEANFANADAAANKWLKASAQESASPNVFFVYRPAKLKATMKDYKFTDQKWKVQVLTIKGRKVTSVWTDPKAEDLAGIESSVRALIQ